MADQRKRGASPVPQQMKRYPQETHSSQGSSDRQLQAPGEPGPPSKRIKQGTSQWSVSIHREEAASPTQYVVYWPVFIMQHTTKGTTFINYN